MCNLAEGIMVNIYANYFEFRTVVPKEMPFKDKFYETEPAR